MKHLLLYIFCLLGFHLWSEESIDSLKSEFLAHPEQMDANHLNLIAWDYYYKDLDSMKLVLDVALSINQTSNKELAKTYTYLGIYHELKAQTNQALEYYTQAKIIQKEINDSVGLAFTYSNLGLFYYTIHDYKNAEINQSKSLELHRLLKDTVSMANNFQNLGIIYTYLDSTQIDQALSFYHQAAEIYQQYHQDYYLSATYVNMAKVYFEKNEYNTSLQLYDKVAQLNPNDPEFLQVSNFSRATIYYQKKEYQKALKFLRQSTQYAEKRGVIEKLNYHYELFHQIFTDLHQSDSALFYYQKQMSVKDSIFNQNLKEKLMELELKYEVEKRDKKALKLELENEQVSHQNELAEGQIKRLYIYLGFGLLLTILIVALLIQKTKTNQTLENKNQIIADNLAEKEVLLKEIHHRVKNNLQLVSTLLVLQEKETDSEELSRIVQESRQRIQTIGLIHQALYQRQNLSGIQVEDYLKTLVDLVRSMSQYKDIDTHFNIETMVLDIDTSIPLALIINELYTNSIKYAFTEDTLQPKINIKLTEINNELVLVFTDNGQGFDSSLIKENFGTKLIRSLSRQLKAQVSTVSNSNGTQVTINIKRYERKA